MPLPTHNKEHISVLGVALLLLVVFAMPWTPQQFLPHDLDSSWVMVLHHGFANGLRWGHDLVWHYGPLGFLYGKFYSPDTYGWLLLLYALFLALFWAGASAVWLKTPVNPIVPMALAMLAAVSDDALFFSYSLMLVLIYIGSERRERQPMFWLLVGACALASMVKFSYFLMGSATVILIELHRLWMRRVFGKVLGIFFAMTLSCWLLLGQQIGDIAPYIRGALELGYGFEAMTTAYQSPYLAYVFAALVISWIFAAAQHLKNSGRTADAALFFCAFMAQLVLVIKAEFLHDNDHHLIQAMVWLFMFTLLSKDLFWHQRSRLASAAILLFAVSGLMLIVVDHAGKSGKELKQLFNAAESVLSDDNASSPAESVATPDDEKDTADFFHGSDSADIYGAYQSNLLANNKVDYRPRPVFQSYHAYTPYLARLNRDFLYSDRAPDRVYFSVDVVLGRYPSIDDGLSWPELLSHYDTKAFDQGYLELVKSPEPRKAIFTPYAKLQTRFNETIEVPAAEGKLIWAKVKIHKSWSGMVWRFFYKLVPVEMEFELASGYTRTDRITPDTMAEGFLLSPLIDNTLHFAMLGTSEEKTLIDRNRLSHIRFTYDSPLDICNDCLFDDDIEVQFYTLDLPKNARSLPPQWDRLQSYALMSSKMPKQPNQTEIYANHRHIDFMQRGGQMLLSLYGDASVTLPLEPDRDHILLGVGSFIASSNRKNNPGPVEVIVEGRKAGAATILAQKLIPELRHGSMSEPIDIDLTFTPAMYDDIVITTKTHWADHDNWVYIIK